MASVLKIFTLLIILNASSCVKEDNLKQNGTNTMTALLGSKHFEKGACWGCIAGGSALIVLYNDTIFRVTAEDGEQNLIMKLEIPSLKTPGLYSLSSQDKNYAIIEEFKPYTRFSTSNTNTGRINITKLDRQRQIISGTFEFSAVDEKNSAHTVSVTAGNFDVTYK